MPNRGRVVKKKINSLLVARGSFTAREGNWHIFLFITPLSFTSLGSGCERARKKRRSANTRLAHGRFSASGVTRRGGNVGHSFAKDGQGHPRAEHREADVPQEKGARGALGGGESGDLRGESVLSQPVHQR